MGSGPSRHFRLKAAVALVMVALGTTVLAWVAVGDDGTEIARGSGGPSEYARYLRLDDGRAGTAAVAGGDRLRVWWRGPDEERWSAPQVVDAGPDRYLLGSVVRSAGTTLAIRATYNTKPPWEDEEAGDEPGVTTSVFVVCQEDSCVASDHYTQVREPECRHGSCRVSRAEGTGGSQVPELSPDGGQVFLGATERGLVVWSADHGLRELEPEGLPDQEDLGTPMLAPDGALRVVAGREEASTCRLRLFISPSVEQASSAAEFTEQLSTVTPTTSGNCATTLEGFTSDQLLIHTDQADPVFLVRTGEQWDVTTEDPTGLVRYRERPGRQAAGSTVRTGYWHGREVVTGSPDGRRLTAQVHFPGEARWTDPVTVAVAPRGLDCFEIAPTSTPWQEPFYVSLRCRSRSSSDAEVAYVGMHALTEDGVTWQSAFGDHLPTRVDEDLYFGGAPAHRWTSAGGLQAVGPPVPANSETFQVDDGTLVLVTARPLGSRCRLVVRVAEPGATRWSTPLSNPDPVVPPREPCRPVGQYDGRTVGLYFPSDGGNRLPGRVARVDGEWVVTGRRTAG